ncbi:MAG: tetratricopeptide repeat protein, partial [Prevotellaceae bacterium]|nr:tetratricopeptide repeat protein [Prevotellaceae bacterium]
MKTTICFTIFSVWALVHCTLLAQSYDHRNRSVDSLEQVLVTHPPEGVDLATMYNSLMMGYLEIDIEKSMLYARKCVAVSIPINEWGHVCDGYYVLGMNHERISQFDSAMIYYHKTLENTQQMNKYPRKYGEVKIDNNYAIVYGAIGNVYNTQGKYNEAIEYYNKALKVFEKYNAKVNQCIAYNNIGYLYLSMDNWPQAAINFSKSDSLALILGDSLYIVGTKIHWSRLALHSKEYAKALQNAEIAYEYYLLHSDEEGVRIVEALNLLTEIYLEGYDNVTRAEEYLRKTLEMLAILDIPREKAISLRL